MTVRPYHSTGMKNKARPNRGQSAVLGQICNLIPPHLVPNLARETGVDKKARTFTTWSHVVCLIYAQLTHAIGPRCFVLGTVAKPRVHLASRVTDCRSGERREDCEPA